MSAFQHARFAGSQHVALGFARRLVSTPSPFGRRLVSISAFSAVRLMPGHFLRDGFLAGVLSSAAERRTAHTAEKLTSRLAKPRATADLLKCYSGKAHRLLGGATSTLRGPGDGWFDRTRSCRRSSRGCRKPRARVDIVSGS